MESQRVTDSDPAEKGLEDLEEKSRWKVEKEKSGSSRLGWMEKWSSEVKDDNSIDNYL